MGEAYSLLEMYSTALPYDEKALSIQENILPSNHLHLSMTYSNIAGLYNQMGHYIKTLFFYEKALNILETILLPTHYNLATVYDNMSGAYQMLGKYKLALSFCEKGCSIRERILPPMVTHILLLLTAVSVSIMTTWENIQWHFCFMKNVSISKDNRVQLMSEIWMTHMAILV